MPRFHGRLACHAEAGGDGGSRAASRASGAKISLAGERSCSKTDASVGQAFLQARGTSARPRASVCMLLSARTCASATTVS
jgi:hypothetical protein